MLKHLVLVLLTVSLIAATAAPVRAAEDNAKGEVVAGNNQFATDLYARLREEPGNLFFSPYSISTALAMTYAGARGDTAEQMAETLRFTAPNEDLHRAMGALVDALNKAGDDGPYELAVANALWAQSGYEFLDEYTDLVTESYRAGLQNVDFQQAAEQARQAINAWVEEQTNNRIKDLIPAGAIDPLTRLVLTNAIYFKGDWANQFDKDATRDRPFTLAGGDKTDVPMMYQKEDFRYAENEDCQVIELPYEGDDLSMLVLLPRTVGDLPALEAKLSPESLENWTRRMRRREVQLYLPRFTMTSEFSLSGTLAAMGMSDAFAPGRADFSGMDGTRELFIQAVVHKAFVDVNEEGTEAAAATGVVVGVTSIGPPPVVFRADHPFLFLIRDNETGSILFIGRVANPKAE